jgi:hypothetical protein
MTIRMMGLFAAVHEPSYGTQRRKSMVAPMDMMMAGVAPMNWLAVAGEWQRDWAPPRRYLAIWFCLTPAPPGPPFRGSCSFSGKRRALPREVVARPTRGIPNWLEECHDQDQCERSREGSYSAEH